MKKTRRTKRTIQHIRRHFRRVDSKLHAALAKMDLGLLREERDPAGYFPKLCREIISQQLAGKAAHAIHERFLKLFPGRRVTPARVLLLSEKKLRATGMSWAKTRYVRDLALKTKARAVRFRDFPSMADEEVILELTKVKGIGRWTAEMFLIFTLGREDVFSHGDLGLKKGVERVYGKNRTRTRKSIEAITKPWSPYRSYGSLALWHVLDSE